MKHSEIVAKYYEEQIVLKGKSKQSYYYIIQRWVDIFEGHIIGGDLSFSDVIDRYIMTRRMFKIKQGTIRRELMVLKSAFNWAKRKGYIDEVPEFDVPAEPPSKNKWLKPSECHLLLQCAQYNRVNVGGKFEDVFDGETNRVHLFIMLGLHTAARKQSILDLTWDQIDLERRRINLNPEGRAQTAKRRPIVPISEQLYDTLRKVKDKAGPVLYHHGSIQQGFYRAVRKAKLKNVTPHTLRHTFATISLQQGVNPYQVAGVMGDSLEMVLERYGHHCPDYLRDAANLDF